MEKVKSLLSIKFNSEPVYGNNDKYIKTKIKTYSDNFSIKKMPKENVPCKCLSIII